MRRFQYRLALAMGCPNVDALAARMTSRELMDWMAYWRLEPFGVEPYVAPEPGGLGRKLRDFFKPLIQQKGKGKPNP